eukprot:5826838-Alexandrium_andersonii.AAC.1
MPRRWGERVKAPSCICRLRERNSSAGVPRAWVSRMCPRWSSTCLESSASSSSRAAWEPRALKSSTWISSTHWHCGWMKIAAQMRERL